MRQLVVLGTLVGALTLALVPTASAGGFATVGFAPLPDGTSAGSTWSPTIYVRQHGIRPMEGLQPVVELYDEAGAMTTFLATATSEPGVYTADVVFPAEGNWRIAIHSGFADSQVTYGPFAIDTPSGGAGDPHEIPLAGLGVAALALFGGVALLLLRRGRALTPAN